MKIRNKVTKNEILNSFIVIEEMKTNEYFFIKKRQMFRNLKNKDKISVKIQSIVKDEI